MWVQVSVSSECFLQSKWECEQDVCFESSYKFKSYAKLLLKPTAKVYEFKMKKNDRHRRREGKLTKPALYKQQKYSPLLWRLLCVPVICVQCVYVVTWNHRENVPRIPGGFGVMARSLGPPEWCWECGLSTEEQQNKGKVPPYFHTFIYTCCHVNACTHTHQLRNIYMK